MTATVDLTPLFGVVETAATLAVERPAADVLDRHLAALSSEDPNARRNAAYQLRYFPDESEKVVAALIPLLEDEESNVRLAVLSVLAAHPEEAAEHTDAYLAILENGKTPYERASAANLLGRTAPASEKVEEALRAAAASDDLNVKSRAEYALKAYLARTKQEQTKRPPGEPVSDEALWFRIELGGTEREILGFIDESKGTGRGYDRAVVDLDGDGTAETVQHEETGEEQPAETPLIRATIDDADWAIDCGWLAHDRPTLREGVARTEFFWSVSKGDGFALFIGGQLPLFDSLARARRAEPTRIGPPFSFEITGGQRGPHALLNVGVKDAAGNTLRVFGRGDDEVPPRVSVRRGETAIVAYGEYG